MTRIEIDDQTKQKLDEIRRHNWSIGGKGHTETVKFLAKHYEDYKSIEHMIDAKLAKIPAIIEQSFRQSIHTAISNILLTENPNKKAEP